MKAYILINEDGKEIESGTCENNQDFITAIGRNPQAGDRWLVGKGSDEDSARQDAAESYEVNGL